MATKPKRTPTVTPFLWFDDQLEDAVAYYQRIFPSVKLHYLQRGPDGKAFTAAWSLGDQHFMGLNAGPIFHFTEAVSFFVNCKDQAEVDYYWDALTADGGEESQCGWLKDKYGLSWQIIPDALSECLGDPDPVKAGRSMQAMLGMRKMSVQGLYDARDGKAPAKVLAAGAKKAKELEAVAKTAKAAKAKGPKPTKPAAATGKSKR